MSVLLPACSPKQFYSGQNNSCHPNKQEIISSFLFSREHIIPEGTKWIYQSLQIILLTLHTCYVKKSLPTHYHLIYMWAIISNFFFLNNFSREGKQAYQRPKRTALLCGIHPYQPRQAQEEHSSNTSNSPPSAVLFLFPL